MVIIIQIDTDRDPMQISDSDLEIILPALDVFISDCDDGIWNNMLVPGGTRLFEEAKRKAIALKQKIQITDSQV